MVDIFLPQGININWKLIQKIITRGEKVNFQCDTYV